VPAGIRSATPRRGDVVRLTHRAVESRDIGLICAFPQSEEELFFMYPAAQYPLTPGQLEAAIAERSDSTVIELEGQVVGFANFYQWQIHGTCSIGNVAVSPQVRGRGVGKYLITQMVELAFSKHLASEVAISCFHRNAVGLLLYAKLGFRPEAIEERRDRMGNRVALIHLRMARP
jgi:ribosomal protein S18 acetylase RimI-like enzyme